MKWDLLCIKLIYRANNSLQNKRHPMDAFFIVKVRWFFHTFFEPFDLFRREYKRIQTAFHKAFFLHFHIQKDRR